MERLPSLGIFEIVEHQGREPWKFATAATAPKTKKCTSSRRPDPYAPYATCPSGWSSILHDSRQFHTRSKELPLRGLEFFLQTPPKLIDKLLHIAGVPFFCSRRHLRFQLQATHPVFYYTHSGSMQ